MQEAVATWHGLKTINTLTGFKWLGEKLAGYEAEMKAKLFEKEGLAVDYDACDIWTKADLMLDYSTFLSSVERRATAIWQAISFAIRTPMQP